MEKLSTHGNVWQSLRPSLFAVLLFAAVYVPAFAVASLTHPPLVMAIPLVIAISLAVALGFVTFLARSDLGFVQVGFARCDRQFLRASVILGTPLAIGVAALTYLFPHKPPFDAALLAQWQLGLYFVAAAPVQEEIIFRGLIQSYLQQRWSRIYRVLGIETSLPVLFTAALFGLIHVGAGGAVAVGAVVLGLAAGELRRRSGSLVPAIGVHALFNLASIAVTS